VAVAVPDLTVHSDEIKQYVQPKYSLPDLDRLEALLFERGVLSFGPLRTGLYPAAQLDEAATSWSGYHYVWVRDNVFVAHAHYVNGRVDAAVSGVRSLSAFFSKYPFRFDDIIAGAVDRKAPMNRPHIRFDGDSLSEVPEEWSHAQNDSLGYFVWLFCNLASAGAIPLTGDGFGLLEKIIAYFRAIRFWEDEDSGHWEEVRKISASSIGVVVGGLEAMKVMLEATVRRQGFGPARVERNVRLLTDLLRRGRKALDAILPAECIQAARQKRRRFDAALLFLVYPIGVVGQAMADRIVGDVVRHLQGDVGIRRYIGDSYWCADYRELFSPQERSGDFSQNMERRDRLLKKGQEAQWCVFDPIISAIYGNRYLLSGTASDLENQIAYFNRSLGQITGALQCPEAYFIERSEYVPNDNRPLLWTQANLWLALKLMKSTAA
jgi:Glycosyl hydrolases family 15